MMTQKDQNKIGHIDNRLIGFNQIYDYWSW
jgi:hypothetical protein